MGERWEKNQVIKGKTQKQKKSMLPLQQAYEVKQSLLEYLKATFSFKHRAVHQAFYKFINHPEEGIFKRPFVLPGYHFITLIGN